MKKLLTLLSLLLTLSWAELLNVTGTVVSDNQKMIGARYMGYVKHIYFNIGDKVKRDSKRIKVKSKRMKSLQKRESLMKRSIR